MSYVVAFLFSASASYLSHNWGERFFSRNGTKKLRLVLDNYQIHHSFFGAAAIATALLFTSGYLLLVLFGYGIGNIWQHKLTHNKLNEKGMVFVSKLG